MLAQLISTEEGSSDEFAARDATLERSKSREETFSASSSIDWEM